MADSKDETQEEPNVVPLIDVSLVILVMALVISSVAGRLLPLEVPKSGKTQLVPAGQTVGLVVARDGTARLGGQAAASLPAAGLSAALGGLKDGTVVLVSAEPGTTYAPVVAAIDAVRAHSGLRIAFGRVGSGPAAGPQAAVVGSR